MAAAIGQPVKILIIIHSLANRLFETTTLPFMFTFDPNLLTYLDGGFTGTDSYVAGFHIETFLLSWWLDTNVPALRSDYLCTETLKGALEFHQLQLQVIQHSILYTAPPFDHSQELNRVFYGWHTATNEKIALPCTQCHLYRVVALGTMDQAQDLLNMVHACETANTGERDVAIRRASGFYQLFKAAIIKEAGQGNATAG